MAELTDIDGVGPSTAEDLTDAGLDTVADIAAAEANDLDEVSLYGGTEAADIIDAARDLFSDDVVSLSLTSDSYDHLYAAVVDELVRRERSISTHPPADCASILDDLRQIATDVEEESREFEFEWTDDELNAVNAAIKSHFQDLRFQPYISRIAPIVRQVEEIRS